MTDKLTPPMWSELAESIRWIEHKVSSQSEVGYLIRALIASFDTEAARREAEARPQGPLTGIEAGPDAVHPKPPADDMERAADAVIDCLREDKPAPAADDLPDRLRTAFLSALEIERIRKDAADRIEGLCAALKNERTDNAEQRARADELEKDRAKWRMEWRAELRARRAAERALAECRDKTIEECANVAAQEQLTGQPDGITVGEAQVARIMFRLTKESITENIRALKTKEPRT